MQYTTASLQGYTGFIIHNVFAVYRVGYSYYSSSVFYNYALLIPNRAIWSIIDLRQSRWVLPGCSTGGFHCLTQPLKFLIIHNVFALQYME